MFDRLSILSLGMFLLGCGLGEQRAADPGRGAHHEAATLPAPPDDDAFTVWARLDEERLLPPESDSWSFEDETTWQQIAAGEVDWSEHDFPGGALGADLRAWIDQAAAQLEIFDAGIARGGCEIPTHSEDLYRQLKLPLRAAELKLLRAKDLVARGRFEDARRDIDSLVRWNAVFTSRPSSLFAGVISLASDDVAASALRWFAFRTDVPIDLVESLDLPTPGPLERVEAVWRGEMDSVIELVSSLPEGGAVEGLAREITRELVDLCRSPGLREREREVIREFEEKVAALLAGHERPFDREATIAALDDLRRAVVHNATVPWDERDTSVAEAILTETTSWPEPLRPASFVAEILIRDFSSSSSDDESWNEIAEEQRQSMSEMMESIARAVLGSSGDPALDVTDADIDAARSALHGRSNPLGKVVLRMLLSPPAFGDLDSLEETFRISESERVATRAVVALRRYLDRFGELPDRLDRLVEAGIVAELPRDPFTGDAIRYSRQRGILWWVHPESATSDPPAADFLAALELEDPLAEEPEAADASPEPWPWTEAAAELVWKLRFGRTAEGDL